MIVCRKCGRSSHEISGWLERVNEKGVPGVWECRPSCYATLTQDEAVIGALEWDEERKASKKGGAS